MPKSKILPIVIIFIGASFFWISNASAATLSLSPSFENKSVGQTFNVSVLVNAQNQAVNAMSGTIIFPADKLEVVGISKTGTIINVWISEPTFSNQAGEINFEGIALNPGYSGAAGKIVTISFKSKDIGLAKTFFSAGSVLANDGTGTNVLTEMSGSEFNILKSEAQGITGGSFTTPSIAADSPKAPEITSPTHPNPEVWYQNNAAKFLWSIDEKVTAVRTLLNKQANSSPTILNEKPITEKEVADLDNGTWYFHLQLKNSKGWGSISHFRINIDNEKPRFINKKFIEKTKTYNPRPEINLSAIDEYSGISSYSFRIDSAEYKNIEPEKISKGIFILPKQEPGKNILFLKATDFAGNETVEYQEFEVLGINPPEIISYPREVKSTESVRITGTTYPDSSVFLSIENDDQQKETFIVRSDSNGIFEFVWPKYLNSGNYSLLAKAQDQNGAISRNSEPYEFKVLPSLIIQVGPIIVSNAYAVYAILIGLLAIISGGIYGWHINFKHGYGLHRYQRKKRKEN